MNNDLGVRIQELRNRLGAADVIIQMFIHGKNMPRKNTKRLQDTNCIFVLWLCPPLLKRPIVAPYPV
ncbi:hypothetical protein [Pseudomonas sp. 24 E 1]|nr:hypothetical protein [Pseudomonas sp. 24 R 17]CRM27535.1 hypothetical protein [Pseudomonas sp. 24 E 1]CRM30818.1 hypothetical protein [Pseudomonas sp. 52 E 6]CRM67529.1 hypothetical protein [Pseudomonas sp. 58 R 12]CRM80373.1 hypothetical protein [Pseudomonas sp. 35 E 8]